MGRSGEIRGDPGRSGEITHLAGAREGEEFVDEDDHRERREADGEHMVCEHVGGGERGHHGGREHLEVTEPEEERPDGGGEPQEKRLDEGGELGHLGAVAVPETTGREWERWWARVEEGVGSG